MLKNDNNSQRSIFKKLLYVLIIPGAIVVAGLAGSKFLIATAPEPGKRPPQREARLVEAMKIDKGTYQIELTVMGKVIAKSSVKLKAQVSGELLDVGENVVPGKTVSKGEQLFKIDSSNYLQSYLSAEANLKKSEASLLIEKGQQSIAKEDYELTEQQLSGDDLDLVLRKPQLMQAEASVASAQAQLNNAQLNLDRTIIKAPFNALILTRSESEGSIISNNTVLAEIADCNEFWINLSISTKDLKWIRPSSEKPLVKIVDDTTWGDGQFRMGRIESISGDVDPKTRMASVIVSVKDPLCLNPENSGKPKLLLGSFVTARIKGREVENVVQIKRDYLHTNDTIWLVNPQMTLNIQSVDVLHRGEQYAILEGGTYTSSRMVTSNLSSPVDGMLLRFAGEKQRKKPEKMKGRMKPSGTSQPMRKKPSTKPE